MRRLKASATVEAAFIVPFISLTVILLIILILMLYDRMRLKGDIGEILEYARTRTETGGEADEAELKALLEEKTGTGYLFCEVTVPDVSVEGSRITASAVIAMRSPGDISGIKFPGLSRVASTTKTEDREKTMRLLSAGKAVLGKVVE